MDPTTCYFCSERIEPGTAKCPFCGEGLTGDRAKLKPIGWGSPQKPMTIAVVGWLMIVFGAFGLFGLMSSAFMFIFIGNAALLTQTYGEAGSVEWIATITMTALGGVSSLLSVWGGYGLLRLRPWGRQLAIGIAIYSIVAAVISPLFTLRRQVASMQAAPEMVAFVIGAVVVGLLISCTIQGLVIFFLTRPHIGAALHRPEAARA